MIPSNELERKVSDLLDDFYQRRLSQIGKLKLKDALKSKNPYLYKAVGVQKASEIVEEILRARVTSSDETIFGNVFFEPLAKYVSGGVISPSEGVDVAIESDSKYTAIAVKSGPNIFNAQSRKRQISDFKSLENRLRKLQKHFDPLVGYCYGKKQQKDTGNNDFRELAGQLFWKEITGEDDFYLRIIDLMKTKPQEHLLEYQESFAAAVNLFTQEFIKDFCLEDGRIDWIKLVKFNSEFVPKSTTKKAKKKP
ncbi:PmeII family type II restriction endonuclease [Anaerospora hongkongensis]|uniref:PmeII family type II restriction endonuclease n=1 Tax=Anaerospora hongkongensis TaxID=244830 RepID=UPI0028975C92|nr:PmeII family type II restriction endonuclease [Anaerospora hongkongensis]